MDYCTPYTIYIRDEEEPFSDDFTEKSTPCATPITTNKELTYLPSSIIITDEIITDEIITESHYSDSNYFESQNKKRKRYIAGNTGRPMSVDITSDSRKSPKYNDTSNKLRMGNLKVSNFNTIMYDKYTRGLKNIKNIQSQKWIKKNINKLGMVYNSELSNVFRDELIDCTINHIISDSMCDDKNYLRNHMTENYTIFDVLHFKILKCQKKDHCVSFGTKCLCRYYHEADSKEDDINCLMDIIFYDTFRRHKCNKLKCKMTNCYFYHDTYNPSPNKINKKIIALLIYIYDNRDRYTNLIKLIKDRLIHLVKKDYIYIINNIGDERKKFFTFIGLNVKSPSKIKEEFMIKKPIAQMRERKNSGSAPVSPIRNKRVLTVLRKPRALSFDKSDSRWNHSMWKKYPKDIDPDRMKLAKSFGLKPKNATEFAEDNLLVAYKDTNDQISISQKKIVNKEDDELIPLNTYLIIPSELQRNISDDTIYLPPNVVKNNIPCSVEENPFSFFEYDGLYDMNMNMNNSLKDMI